VVDGASQTAPAAPASFTHVLAGLALVVAVAVVLVLMLVVEP